MLPLHSRKLIMAVMLLFVMGLVMIFNTSSADVLDRFSDKGTHAALIKQIGYGVLGAFLGLIVYKFGYEKLLELSPLILMFLSLLLLLVFVPGIGVIANGARRWISVAGISLQPSEFVKFSALLYCTYCFMSTDVKTLQFDKFLKLLAPLGVPLFLILIEPNNGTVCVIASALVALLFLMKVPLRFFAVPMLGAFLIVGAFALKMPYVRARIEVYLHPELDLKGKGHQPYQAKIASGSGGLLGKGPGKSLQKLSYLPEAQNDYIAAIFAEEYGFVGILCLVGIYSWIAYLGYAIGLSCPDRAGLYIACSFTFLLSLQAFLNLGVVSGMLPSTGLNLPFFSQGGSSLIANSCGLAVLMSIAKKRSLCLNES
jgi:cell division protein FtsW